MRFDRRMLSLLLLTLLTTPGCLVRQQFQEKVQKRNALERLLNDWKGKPVRAFLTATGWRPTGESVRKDGVTRDLVFNALGTWSSAAPGQTLSYGTARTWDGTVTATAGANQPLIPPPGSYVSVENVQIPGNSGWQNSCRLTLQIDDQGIIQEWKLKGSECFINVMNTLKPYVPSPAELSARVSTEPK